MFELKKCEVCGKELSDTGTTHCSEECLQKSIEGSKKFDPNMVDKRTTFSNSDKLRIIKKPHPGLHSVDQIVQDAKTVPAPEPRVVGEQNLRHRMITGLEDVASGSHVLYTYREQESKFEEALKFLKKGLDKNEATAMIFNKRSGDEVRQSIKENGINIGRLESEGLVEIMTPDESYYKNGFPDTSRVIKFWEAKRKNALARGMSGFRVFADMHSFFENGDVAEVINYESGLSDEFESTLTGICAYNFDDIKGLTREQCNVLAAHQTHYLN